MGSLSSDTRGSHWQWDLGHRRCSNLQSQLSFQGTKENEFLPGLVSCVSGVTRSWGSLAGQRVAALPLAAPGQVQCCLPSSAQQPPVPPSDTQVPACPFRGYPCKSNTGEPNLRARLVFQGLSGEKSLLGFTDQFPVAYQEYLCLPPGTKDISTS